VKSFPQPCGDTINSCWKVAIGHGSHRLSSGSKAHSTREIRETFPGFLAPAFLSRAGGQGQGRCGNTKR